MLQQKRTIKCPIGSKRFIVLHVDGDLYAGRSFETAMAAAQPDNGSHIPVFATCAREVGEARMLFKDNPKQLIRAFTYNSKRKRLRAR